LNFKNSGTVMITSKDLSSLPVLIRIIMNCIDGKTLVSLKK